MGDVSLLLCVCLFAQWGQHRVLPLGDNRYSAWFHENKKGPRTWRLTQSLLNEWGLFRIVLMWTVSLAKFVVLMVRTTSLTAGNCLLVA